MVTVILETQLFVIHWPPAYQSFGQVVRKIHLCRINFLCKNEVSIKSISSFLKVYDRFVSLANGLGENRHLEGSKLLAFLTKAGKFVFYRPITLKRSLCHNQEIFLKKLKTHSAVVLNFLLKRKDMKQIVKVTLMMAKPRMKVNVNLLTRQSSLYDTTKLPSLLRCTKIG